MSFPLAYSALRWENPNLEQALVQLREAGWDGWEARQSLDWLGSARRVSSDLRRRWYTGRCHLRSQRHARCNPSNP